MMKTAYLTDQDRELIMTKVNYNNANVDLNEERTMEIIETNWAKAKSKKLFDIFGGELIKKKQINMVKSKEQFRREFRDERFPFVEDLIDFIYRREPQLPYNDREFITSLTRPSTLYSNRVPSNYTLELNGKKPVKFSEGQKLGKALKQVCDIIGFDAEEHGFEQFRIRHSQMLNDKTIKGTLCLSIHPMDYMTMSDNNNGWESCMSWDNEGCYRVGTLECMNCENTIVAYVESDTKQYRIGFTDKYWNSKRYRQLVMITDEVIMTNKGYPFNNENLSNEVLNWVAELCGEDFEGENIDYDEYKSYDIEGFNYINVVTNMMYDDTDNGSNSFVRLNKKHNKLNGVKTVELGGEAMCLKCGSHCDDEEALICYDCSDKFYCDCCDETCHGEQYDTADGVVCEYCFDNHYATCEECGVSYDRDWGRIQYLDEDDLEKYVDGERMYSGYYCEHCMSKMELKPESEDEE